MRKLILQKGGSHLFNCRESVISEEYFKIKTLEEAQLLSVVIANNTNNPNENLVICELLNNAIEHGNLGITYDEKSELIEKDIFLEEIERRQNLLENREKYAEVIIEKCIEGGMMVTITDQGKGFDFNKYLSIDNSRLFESHGRGIAIANTILKIQYLDKGNKVMVYFPA
jgi:anti-sigma regulatory factor (Ser/Thr protein kinase)